MKPDFLIVITKDPKIKIIDITIIVVLIFGAMRIRILSDCTYHVELSILINKYFKKLF